MKKIENKRAAETTITCGNCWGHQEWNDQTVAKEKQREKSKKEGFILEFARKIK